MLIKINHPKADSISIVDGIGTYSTETESEIAFFKNGEWVTEPIEPFADYHDGSTSDTAVYAWVPNTLIDAFLAENGAVAINR